MQSPLRVLIVDETPERAALIETRLVEAGCEVLGRLIGRADLRETIAALQPDVIIVDMECPDRDALEDMSRMPRPRDRDALGESRAYYAAREHLIAFLEDAPPGGAIPMSRERAPVARAACSVSDSPSQAASAR